MKLSHSLISLSALAIGLSALTSTAWASKVRLTTNMGDIVIDLASDKAPKTVANFEAYVKSGHYKGTIFHRVIDGFMIQGGGFTQNMEQKPTLDPIAHEGPDVAAKGGLPNARGTIAMARTGDPHSATAQFFINVKDNAFLNYRAPNSQAYGYVAFGQVTQGMDVVDKIKSVSTGRVGPFSDVPREPVVILNATLEP
jgi:peptidyl-prolyl cis-trans isomerase B (cyclophilin B)